MLMFDESASTTNVPKRTGAKMGIRPFRCTLRPARLVLACQLLLLLSCSQSSDLTEARSVREIRETGLCPACAIELVEVARLGSPEDPVSVRPDVSMRPCMVAELPEQGWVVSALVGGGELGIYDTTGAMVREVGRSGEGPGEYGRDMHVVVRRGETVSVVDNSYLRVTTLSDNQSPHIVRLPRRVQSLALLASGALLVHGRPTGTEEGVEDRFTLVDLESGELRSFEDSDKDLADLDQWVVSGGYDGGFWAASGWKYELHRWANPDSLEYTLVRESVEWFPSDNAYSDDMYESEPPPAWFTHMWETKDGLLWTYSLVPDEDWAPESPQAPNPAWNERVLDTMIEVVEIAGGQVLAQLRFGNTLAPVCGNAMMYTAEETETGDVRVVVLEPRLVR